MDIRNGDCLELMKTIPDKSVDLFICDLPYGETNCKWDSVIDLEAFWKEFKRIRKTKRTACIHFCSTKFGYTLIKSWEKGFKMDLVWKKRNKTGGITSRYRPMRNHEMVYFFYDQCPKYNRDKYHTRINTKSHTLDTNVDGSECSVGKSSKMATDGYIKCFSPVNPGSVLEDKEPKGKEGITYVKNEDNYLGIVPLDTEMTGKGDERLGGPQFEPKLPASVVEPDKVEGNCKIYLPKKHKYKKGENTLGTAEIEDNHAHIGNPQFEPINPASVIEEEEPKSVYGITLDKVKESSIHAYIPPNPCSVFDSKKVFIGKRHHQTEKPTDILEWFLKYYSDEGETILDPTMGSGSTGVACKKMKRKFIGFEMNTKIFETAKKRIEETEVA